MKQGFFITLEGPDGCGKSTQSALLVRALRDRALRHTQGKEMVGGRKPDRDHLFHWARKWLGSGNRKKGLPVVHTREPGGTSFAENLRRILLNPKYKILPLSELLLYEASRAQHTEEVIRPAIQQGKIVVCERYTDATTAYQGYGRGLSLSTIAQLNKIATGNLVPDCTIVLDMPVNQAMKRSKNKIKDRLEQEKNSFHHRVRKGYFMIAKKEPKRVKIIPANGSVQEVHQRIWKIVTETIHKSYSASSMLRTAIRGAESQ